VSASGKFKTILILLHPNNPLRTSSGFQSQTPIRTLEKWVFVCCATAAWTTLQRDLKLNELISIKTFEREIFNGTFLVK